MQYGMGHTAYKYITITLKYKGKNLDGVLPWHGRCADSH